MGVKRALLVHNNTFIDKSFRPLFATSGDVARLKTLLQQDYVGFKPDNIVELENPGLTDFQTAILEFYRSGDVDDYLFFYYAGHGVCDDFGQLYLALKRTTYTNFEAQSLDAGFIGSQLKRSRTKKKVVMLDCCNASGFSKNDGFVPRDVEGGFSPYEKNFDPRGSGTYILGASQTGSSAYEKVGPDGNSYSLYTSAFIKGIESGEAAPFSETIKLSDISDFIHEQRNNSGKATNPYFSAAGVEGQLEFARNPSPKPQSDKVALSKTTIIQGIGRGKFLLWLSFVGFVTSGLAFTITYFSLPKTITGLPQGSETTEVFYYGDPASPEKTGLTWVAKGYLNEPKVIQISCFSEIYVGGKCNPIRGDSECSNEFPILCINADGGSRGKWPGSGEKSPRWSGARVRMTRNVAPHAKLSDADRFCRDNFGPDYRVAEFHDSDILSEEEKEGLTAAEIARQTGWAFEAERIPVPSSGFVEPGDGIIKPGDGPFWVDINDQPNGTCWSRE